ncbi:hypothetical protein C8Q70DRAFT_1054603 [Cubamyces menziesii]|nr:hypothetical protein C8Q70DRAFT_1054603 [Cubamyces menziesii]
MVGLEDLELRDRLSPETTWTLGERLGEDEDEKPLTAVLAGRPGDYGLTFTDFDSFDEA